MEKHIQKKIVDYLKSQGAYVVKVSLAGRSGVPDILCCHKGRFIAIEVKAEQGQPTKLQEYNILQIQRAQGLAFIARSVDDVKAVLALSNQCGKLTINGINKA